MKTLPKRIFWHIPPNRLSQTVLISYGADWEEGVVWRRRLDRSTGEITYQYAPVESVPQNGDHPDWEPWNREPTADWKDSGWKTV